MVTMGAPPPTDPRNGWMGPKIIAPYVEGMLHYETAGAVTGAGYQFKFLPLDPSDPYAYARTFRSHWDTGNPLLWVEQDIVPPEGAFKAMVECDRPWCGHAYHCNTGIPAWGLGMCKFSLAMQLDVPTLGTQASRDYRGNLDRRHWQALNERVQELALHFGYKIHLHAPVAGHLHDYGTGDVAAG